MDTTADPIVLKIKRAVEDAVGFPAHVEHQSSDLLGAVYQVTILIADGV